MTRKININYTINENEFFVVMRAILKEKSFYFREYFDDVYFSFKTDNFDNLLKNISKMKNKLTDLLIRLDEVQILVEDMRKFSKNDSSF